MNKLIRRLAATAVPAVAAAGALLATGGSATAATARPASPESAQAAPALSHPCRRTAAHQHIDPWVAGQLALFEPAAAHRAAVYDPWVKDQLAQFANEGC